MKRPQLFLLHFAGGNCYSFQFLTPLLHGFDVIALELPGRGRRMEEPLLTDFDQAAEDVCRQIRARLNGAGFMIYGHSMGAYLGLRATSWLEENGKPPLALVVSGNAGPGMRDIKSRYLLEHDAFVAELRKLGGVPEELFENRELFDFFEPILRADFEIAERNNIENAAAVNVPLYAIMGSEEEKAASIDNWGRFTHSFFNAEVLPGDHFFIHRHPHRLMQIIRLVYNQATLVQHNDC
nr:alpha/beta fold hydrolase [uncultured Chitinophaga sp.]